MTLGVRDRAVGAYLGLAVGDALGATTEFMTPREIAHHHVVHRDLIGGGWLKLKAGAVTDDTEMALALGEAILGCNGAVEAGAVAEAFSRWMRGRPVDIGNTVRRGISHYRRTGVPHVDEHPEDAGNGACMRCLPIALLNWQRGEDRLLRDSRAQAHVTHHCATADAGTESVLRMLVEALRGKPPEILLQTARHLVMQYPGFAFEKGRTENPSGWIVETLQTVFQCLFGNDSFETVLIDVVNRGGDADTTGAIAGMLAGAIHGRAAIPRRWLDALDADVRSACERQALQLLVWA
jgi:ADP-ribosyl-[dinitrogen reductase] hydrolase